MGTGTARAARCSGWTRGEPVTVLARFAGTGPGPRISYSNLVADADGNLYGTTYLGGGHSKGTIFRVSDAGFVSAAGAVPEPATWGMMILGFGMAGASMRRRRRTTITYA